MRQNSFLCIICGDRFSLVSYRAYGWLISYIFYYMIHLSYGEVNRNARRQTLLKAIQKKRYNIMQEKDFVSYEYRTVTVKAKDQIKAMDMYEAFGWEVTATSPALVDNVTLSLKRDRKQLHKQELVKLERQAQDTFETINGLERSKTMGASIFAYIFGCIAALVLGAVPGQVFQRASTAYLTGSAVPEGQLSETHYLMMGMNDETYGGHSPDDVAFSQSFETLAQRKQANLRVAWERIEEKGLMGNLRFFVIKAYKAYADGSFAVNSSFLDLEIPKRTDALSTFLRSLYHKKGSLNPLCHTVAQGLWLAMLMLCAVACFTRRRHPAVQVFSLALMGATAYLLLFEVWPRYLFVFAPLYLLLAAMAVDVPLPARWNKRRAKA